MRLYLRNYKDNTLCIHFCHSRENGNPERKAPEQEINLIQELFLNTSIGRIIGLFFYFPI